MSFVKIAGLALMFLGVLSLIPVLAVLCSVLLISSTTTYDPYAPKWTPMNSGELAWWYTERQHNIDAAKARRKGPTT